MSVQSEAKKAVEACISMLSELEVRAGLSSSLRSAASDVRIKLLKDSDDLVDLAVDLSHKSESYRQELTQLSAFLRKVKTQVNSTLAGRLEKVALSLDQKPDLYVQAILADTSQAENIDEKLGPLTLFLAQVKAANTTASLTRFAEVVSFLLEIAPPPPPLEGAKLDLAAFAQEALEFRAVTNELANELDGEDRDKARGFRSTGLKAHIGVTKALLVMDAEHAAELGKKLDLISDGLAEKLERIRAAEKALARCLAVLDLIATVLGFVAKI